MFDDRRFKHKICSEKKNIFFDNFFSYIFVIFPNELKIFNNISIKINVKTNIIANCERKLDINAEKLDKTVFFIFLEMTLDAIKAFQAVRAECPSKINVNSIKYLS